MSSLLQDLGDWLARLGVPHPLQQKLLVSAAVVVVIALLRLLLMRLVRSRTEDVRVRYQWKKLSAYIAVLLGSIAVGRIWFEGLQDLATYLGLLSAGVAIALKDLLVNLAGWSFILWRRPFEVGDRIAVGESSGDVIDQRIFQFTLMEIGNWVAADQSTGRIIHVPNGLVFTRPVANFSKGFQFIWNEIPVLVTFESHWEKAKEILQRIADRHSHHLSESAQQQVHKASRRFMIFYTKLTPTVYTSVEDSGVLLTVRYLCEPRRRRSSAQAIWEDILREFGAAGDIDFAYPTRRFYDNTVEGKEGARADRPALPPPFRT